MRDPAPGTPLSFGYFLVPRAGDPLLATAELRRVLDVAGAITDGASAGPFQGPVDQWVDEVARPSQLRRVPHDASGARPARIGDVNLGESVVQKR